MVTAPEGSAAADRGPEGTSPLSPADSLAATTPSVGSFESQPTLLAQWATLFLDDAILLVDIPPSTSLATFAPINQNRDGAQGYRFFRVLIAASDTQDQAILVTHPTHRIVQSCLDIEHRCGARAFWIPQGVKSVIIKHNKTDRVRALTSQMSRLLLTGANEHLAAGLQDNVPFLFSMFPPDRDTHLLITGSWLKDALDIKTIAERLYPLPTISTAVSDLAELAHRLLIQYINGSTGFYPASHKARPGVDTSLGEEGEAWVQERYRDLHNAVSHTDTMQTLADELSQHLGIGRMHANQLYDRIQGIQGRELRSEHSYSTPSDRENMVLAFLRVIDLINHPPAHVHPDDISTLKMLDCSEIIVYTNIARSTIANSVYKTNTCLEWCRDAVKTAGLSETSREALRDIVQKPRTKPHLMEMAAAGIRNDSPLLQVDIATHQCQPRPQSPPMVTLSTSAISIQLTPTPLLPHGEREGAAPPFLTKEEQPETPLTPGEEPPTDHGTPIPLTSGKTPYIPVNPHSEKQFHDVFQQGLVGDPSCFIILRGLRTGAFGSNPYPESWQLEAAMTPFYHPARTRFTQVKLTALAFEDTDEGEVEVSFVFASSAHANIAWLTIPKWIHLVQIQFPTAMNTFPHTDHNPLAQVKFLITSWYDYPAVREFQRAFVNPDLPETPVTVRLLSKTPSQSFKRVNGVRIAPERQATIRVSYSSPLQTANMIGRKVKVFERHLGRLPTYWYSLPGSVHVPRVLVLTCELCGRLGHRGTHCRTTTPGATFESTDISPSSQPHVNAPPTPPSPPQPELGIRSRHVAKRKAAELGGRDHPRRQPQGGFKCKTCALVRNWDNCGMERCQLAKDFDETTHLMAAAAEEMATKDGFFSQGARELRASLFC